MNGHMIEHRVDRDNNVGLDIGKQAYQSIMDKRRCHRLNRRDRTCPIAEMKETPIESGVIADSWSIEFDSLTQGKTTILLKDIDDLDAIGRRWCWRYRCFCCPISSTVTVLLTCMPLFL